MTEQTPDSSAADAVIAALRSGHEELAPIVEALPEDALTGPSGAAEWDLSQVLSHLGSGAEISGLGLEAALAGRPNPGMDSNRAVWARWDAMSPQERRTGFLTANGALLESYDALDAGTRADLRIDLGFLPAPVDLATATRFRLNEFALHSWDVRVALDPDAVVAPEAVAQLVDMAGGMLGWLAKPATLGRTASVRVTLTGSGRTLGLSLTPDSASVGEPPQAPDAELRLADEAWLRLLTGRLGERFTPSSTHVEGDVSLAELRSVFTGF